MKILCVEPGPSHSTIDVYNGLVKGLREVGHQVGVFALHNRIQHADQCLQLRWEAAGSPEANKPGANEVVFHASGEIVQYALYHEVDWVLFISCGLVHDAVYTMLRRAGVPTGMVMTESPYEDERQSQLAPLVDVVWTNEISSVEILSLVNPNTFYLPHGYDPEIHHPADPDPEVPSHDVIFVGTLWQERIDLLSEIGWNDINLGIYGSAELFDLDKYPQNAQKRERLAPFLHIGYTDNALTIAMYRSARLGINLHRRSIRLRGPQIEHESLSMNPRCYEQAATGGALLVTDYREEVGSVFGEAAPVFHDPLSLKQQIDHLLSQPTEVRHRVDELRRRVEPHTLTARAAQITDDWASSQYLFKRSYSW